MMKEFLCLMICAGLLSLSPEIGVAKDPQPRDVPRAAVKPSKKATAREMTAKEKKAYEAAKKRIAESYQAAKKKEREIRLRAAREEKANPRAARKAKAKRRDAFEARVARDAQAQARAVQLEKQFKPIFQKLLNVELSFVQRICPLTAEQHKRLAVAAEGCLKDTLGGYVKKAGGRRRGQVFLGNGIVRVMGADTDPRHLIQQGVLKIVKDKLGPEQAKLYQEENIKRAASKKNTTIRFLVALLDHKLILDAKQREQLTKSLDSNWEDKWGRSLESLIHNSQYFPQVADKHVVPFLSDRQKTVWRGIQKADFGRHQNFGQNMAVVVDDFKLGVKAEPENDAALKTVEEPAGKKKE